jgi:hypothetical protein
MGFMGKAEGGREENLRSVIGDWRFEKGRRE